MEEGGLAERVEESEINDRGSSRENDFREVEETRAEYESREKVYNSGESPKQTKSKKGKSNSRKLASIIQESKEEARAFGIEESEYFSTHSEKIIAYLKEHDDSEETWQGAVAIICNVRKGEFLIEEEYGKQAGKLRLIGGQKEFYDASTFETEAREIEEEVKEPAKHILLKYLREYGTRYGSITNIINGGEVKSDIIKIPVSSIKDWEIVSKAQPMGGAGHFHIKTYDELWSMPDSAFEYDHGPIIKKFILEELVRDKNFLNYSQSSNHMSPLTANNSHLQSVNSFNIYSPSSN